MQRVVIILRALFRRALSEYRREAPTLVDIIIEQARGRAGPRLGAEFSDGRRAWAAVRATDFSDFCEARNVWHFDSLRCALLREAREVYTQTCDEHRTERAFRERDEQLEQLRRMASNGPLVERLESRIHELQQQIQRHRRTRPTDETPVPDDQPRQSDGPPRLRGWWLERWSEFRRPARARRENVVTFEEHARACQEPTERIARKKAAQERGMKLLKESLSPVQRKQSETLGYFEVTGGETGTRYRIRPGHQMNVEKLDKNGRSVLLLCFMPKGQLVIGDVMLAQKIALELYESDALRIANKISPHFNGLARPGASVVLLR